MIIAVHYPDITPEENQRRLNEVRRVGEQILYNIMSDPERREKFMRKNHPELYASE